MEVLPGKAARFYDPSALARRSHHDAWCLQHLLGVDAFSAACVLGILGGLAICAVLTIARRNHRLALDFSLSVRCPSPSRRGGVS
jgi:hypothetical protein